MINKQKNADDDEYIDNPPSQIDNIKSQPQENLINRLLLKRFTIKLIDLILSNIVRYEKNISSDDFINRKIETKDKWNQIHLLSMEFMLGANCRIPLIYMSNRKIRPRKKMNVSMSFLLHICLIQLYTQTKFLRSK